MFGHYARLAFIRTGPRQALARHRAYAVGVAKRFGLRYEELDGSTALVKGMVRGPWDDRFVAVAPGETARFEDFWPSISPVAAAATEGAPPP